MIKIKEVLPNPVGRDTDGEYIVLVNQADTSVSLQGYLLRDKSGKSFRLDGYELPAGAGLQFNYSVTKLTLNNSDEVLELLNPAGEVEDFISYTAAPAEGQPVLQASALSAEVRAQLFDELAGPGRSIASPTGIYSGQFWLIMLLASVVLAFLALYIFKQAKKKDHGVSVK